MKQGNIKHQTGYGLLYATSYLFALMPLRALYVLSDILYFFAYHVLHYRRKTVRCNIVKSFPNMTNKEIRSIEKKFYHHLGDYYVETIKLLHISDEEMKRRMVFENTELVDRLAQNKQWGFLALGHYANWEWVSSLGLYLDCDIKLGQIYKKLSNRAFDRLFLKIRSRFGATSIEKSDTLRAIVREKNNNNTMLIGFIADQRPPRNYEHYWTKFMNQDTLVQTGMERIACNIDCAVLYLDVRRVKRGYYRARLSTITDHAAGEPEFAITENYMRRFEETIMRDPQYYLWSHKRWKFVKKERYK